MKLFKNIHFMVLVIFSLLHDVRMCLLNLLFPPFLPFFHLTSKHLLINSAFVISNIAIFTVIGILYWRDLVRSGLVFSIGCFFFFLVIVGEYSCITLGSYMALTVLLVSYGYIRFQTIRGGENPFKYVCEEFCSSDSNTTHSMRYRTELSSTLIFFCSPFFRERLQHVEVFTKEQIERHVESLWTLIEATKGVLIEIFFTSDTILTLKVTLKEQITTTLGHI